MTQKEQYHHLTADRSERNATACLIVVLLIIIGGLIIGALWGSFLWPG
jgi:hypothetical protein